MMMGVMGGFGLLMVAALLRWAVAAAAGGHLDRNGMVGIRTQATTASDEAWRLGHQAVLPAARTISLLTGVIAVALIVAGAFAWRSAEPTLLVLILFGVGYAGVVVGAIVLVVVANRGARSASDPPA